MNPVTLAVLAFTAVLAQGPGPQPPPSPLAQDQDLQGVIARARQSDQPQLKLLARQIDGLIATADTGDPSDFKLGAMSVFRHCDSSHDFGMREAYLRLMQYPVIEQVYAAFEAARNMRIDGSPRDWPKEAVVTFPKPQKSTAKTEAPVLRAFGALRGADNLYILFQTYDKPELNPTKLIYTVEVSLLATRFAEVDYTINIAANDVRIFDSAGEEIVSKEEQPIEVKAGARAIEVLIPAARIELDLRSAVLRGYVMEPRTKISRRKSPWVACPTGPVSEPLKLLIDFAVKRELPAGNTLPLAVALQEGLLQTRAAAELAEHIRADAYAWLQAVLEIDGRIELTDTRPPRDASFAGQLAWCNRYNGARSLSTLQAYDFRVPSPQTLADMRGYIEVKGWISADTTAESLRQQVLALIHDRARLHDYPNDEARAQGQEYVEPDPSAYYVQGETRLLCYRDVGINDRWKLFEGGFGLKGSARQITEFQRLLSNAVGLPTVWAYQLDSTTQRFLTLSLSVRRKRWFTVGAEATSADSKEDVRLIFGRPWTRPERFDFWEFSPLSLPEGHMMFLLTAGVDEISPNRLTNIIEKGIPDNQFDDLLLPAVRLR